MTIKKKSSYVNTLAFKPLYNYLKQKGFDSEAEKILQVSGVSIESIGSHLDQCTLDSFYKAYHFAISITGDDLLGLHVGQSIHPANMGLLGYAMLNCETTRDALYLVLSSNIYGFGNDTIGFSLEFEFEGNLGKMIMNTEENPNWIRPWIELTTAGWISNYHHLTNFAYKERQLFKEVAFPFADRGKKREYEKVLGCPVIFNSSTPYILADQSILDQKVYTADRYALSVFMDQLGISSQRGSCLIDEVRHKIKAALPKSLSADDIAVEYGISISTLKRRLKREGMTYNKVCLDLKMEMAEAMLLKKELSIDEISYYLGYSKPSAFYRLFKREKGMTPSQFREQSI